MLVDVHGPAHPDEVWRRFTTPAEWSGWAPQIASVDCTDDVVAVGSTGRVHGPAGVAVDFTVTALDAGLRTWSWLVGRGALAVTMHHHVLPAPDGGARAQLRVPPPAATVLQPYRLVAGAALRRVVRPEAGTAAARAAEPVRSFDFAFSPTYLLSGRLFGITPRTASVEVSERWLYVRYGPWRLVTPRANIASVEPSGGFAFVKTAGPPHLSLADRGVSFTTNGDAALCLTFREPVPAIDPTGAICHPGATLSVADPHALAEALGF